jgi:hypothetical protein
MEITDKSGPVLFMIWFNLQKSIAAKTILLRCFGGIGRGNQDKGVGELVGAILFIIQMSI